MESRGAVIRLESLTKRYGRVLALDGLSMEVLPGEVLGFLGPNGAGKTTTVSVLTTLVKADGGTVHVAGHDIAALAAPYAAVPGDGRLPLTLPIMMIDPPAGWPCITA